MESIHAQSQPATRYSTPVPPRMYQPSNQQHVTHPYQQQQQQHYNYPQPPQYEHSPYAFTDEYGTAVSTRRPNMNPGPHASTEEDPSELTNPESSQPYSTPATSPPSPSRNNEVRVTRTRAYPRGGKEMTTTRPPAAPPAPKKKGAKDRPKAVKKSPHLSASLSVITKDSPIPVIDIAAYVNRSTEERVHEVKTGKIPGKVKRPMNAFMLYRKAYQNRAKDWCSQHNHQIVSQVCGDSWPLEPDSIRAQFTEWAKLERDNHQKAHPSYKFTPSKPNKAKAAAPAKRGRDDADDDDPNDPEWHGSSAVKRMRRMDTPVDDDDYDQRSYYGGGGGYQQNRSTFHATNPGKPIPQPYDAHAGQHGHYYQTMQVRDGEVEHIMYKKTPTPGMMHHHTQQQHHGYDELGGYGPPPPQQHHSQHPPPQYFDQHLQIQQQHAQYSPTQRVDPSLLPGATGDELLLGGYNQYSHELEPGHPGPWSEGPGQEQVYLDETTTYQFGQYAVPGDEFGAGSLLGPPEQDKVFNQDPWTVLSEADGALAGGDEWDAFGAELPVGKAEGEGAGT